MDTDCSEYEDDDSDPIDDNFHVGIATHARSTQEESPSLVENQIKNILRRESYLVIHSTNKLQTFLINNIIHFKILEGRELVSTVKYSNVFRLFTKELVNEYNSNNEKKIERSLQVDVKSRWNSTFYMLESIAQVIQSDQQIRPETIGSDIGLHRNPPFSIQKPIGPDPNFIGFLTNGFRTGLRRKRSDRFLSNPIIGYCRNR